MQLNLLLSVQRSQAMSSLVVMKEALEYPMSPLLEK